ncbi:MAG: GatB/YqeY domain-containing protein [Salinisphaeraceae bacterium]|nr:GatB/YqeY domain-containing protein [Salinisphaeraceae bacterium]
MSLKDRIATDVKDAMRAKDKARLTTLRLLQAAIKQREVDERIELDDAAVVAIVEKQIKQRREAAQQYSDAGRDELAQAEQEEIAIFEPYLPEQLSDAEVDAAIAQAIEATGASGMADMGKVMGQLKPQLQGKADMGQVSGRVKAKLSS